MVEREPYSVTFPGALPLELGVGTVVMGVINVTPDSFSDGGRHDSAAAAVDRALQMADAGAGIIDVGGESTRPGADPVSAAEEAARVLPVISALSGKVAARISIDTMKASVARPALDAGADIVNDVSSLRDPEMLQVVVERQAPVVLMHMRGTPRTMQRHTNYDNLLDSVIGFLEDRVESCVKAGLGSDKIIVDPGIGFGKTPEGSLALLKHLPSLKRIGRPILIGASRKSFIGATLGLALEDRLEASVAAAVFASAQGAHIVRVHDVAASSRAVRLIDALREI